MAQDDHMDLDEFIVPSSIGTPAGVSPAPSSTAGEMDAATTTNLSAISIKQQQRIQADDLSLARASVPSVPPLEQTRTNHEFSYVQRRVRKTSIDERRVRFVPRCWDLCVLTRCSHPSEEPKRRLKCRPCTTMPWCHRTPSTRLRYTTTRSSRLLTLLIHRHSIRTSPSISTPSISTMTPSSTRPVPSSSNSPFRQSAHPCSVAAHSTACTPHRPPCRHLRVCRTSSRPCNRATRQARLRRNRGRRLAKTCSSAECLISSTATLRCRTSRIIRISLSLRRVTLRCHSSNSSSTPMARICSAPSRQARRSTGLHRRLSKCRVTWTWLTVRTTFSTRTACTCHTRTKCLLLAVTRTMRTTMACSFKIWAWQCRRATRLWKIRQWTCKGITSGTRVWATR